VSFEACISYYLQLSHRRFAQHHLFLLHSYDLVRNRTTWRQAHLQASLNETENAAINNLSDKDVAIAVQYELDCNEARQRGQPLPVPHEGLSPSANLIISKVKAAAKNVMGTNETRRAMYLQVNGMRNMYGAPHIFITINLNEKTAFAVLQYAGVRQSFDLEGLIPNRQERDAIIARDPVAAAQFFEDSMCVVYKSIFGIDPETAKILKRGGLFGHCEHFFSSKETQRRGALHEHILVWLMGFPKTWAEFNRTMRDRPEYKALIDKYVASIVQCSLPINTTGVPCPECLKKDINSTVDPVKVKDWHRSKTPYRTKKAPHLVKCSKCDFSTTSLQWLKHCIGVQEANIGHFHAPNQSNLGTISRSHSVPIAFLTLGFRRSGRASR